MTECIKSLKFAQVHESFLKSSKAFLKAFEAGSFFVEVMLETASFFRRFALLRFFLMFLIVVR